MFRIKLSPAWRAVPILIIISAIYTVASLTLLRTNNENIEFTRKELEGVKDYERVVRLYFDLHETQHPKDILARLDAMPASPHNKAWRHARMAMNAEQNPSVADTSRLLRNLIRDIGDESNMILDPQIASYYAINIIISHVPLLVEHILIYSGSSAAFADLPYHIDGLDHALRAVNGTGCKECAGLMQSASMLEKGLLGHLRKPIRPSEARRLLAETEKIAQASSHLLEKILERRLEGQYHRQRRILVIVLTFYILLMAMMITAVQNYVSKREVALAAERKKLIEQLAIKNDELDKFAHAAAHDLKEPVRTMSCFATLLKRESGHEMSAPAGEYIEIIESSAKRAERMIDDLLGYTQFSEEKFATEPCDCNAEVANVLQDLKPVWTPIDPVIRVDTLPVIRTVPSMFHRVMLNLIGNAIKYRRHDQALTIRIQAELEGEYWLFSVSDNGIGISKEHLRTVFEPFRRLEVSVGAEGNGIGLTSCKKIVERLGGEIWIKSMVNQGSCVYFTLPATPL